MSKFDDSQFNERDLLQALKQADRLLAEADRVIEQAKLTLRQSEEARDEAIALHGASGN